MVPTFDRAHNRRRPLASGRPWLTSGALVVLCLTQLACSQSVLIRTVPDDVKITVDGEEQGKSPVVVERTPGLFGEIAITAEAEGFTPSRVVIEQDQWFLWPALIAVTPFLALPFLVFFPPIGPIITVAWAIVTSPTLLSLAFIRRYPATVDIVLTPKQAGDTNEYLPTDWWTIPDDYAPNPLPLGPGETERDNSMPAPMPQASDDHPPSAPN